MLIDPTGWMVIGPQCDCHKTSLDYSSRRVHTESCPVAKGFQPLPFPFKPFKPEPEPMSERLVESARSIAAYKFKEWEDIGYDLSQCPYANGTPEYAHWRRLEADKIDNAWSESQTWSGKVSK